MGEIKQSNQLGIAALFGTMLFSAVPVIGATLVCFLIAWVVLKTGTKAALFSVVLATFASVSVVYVMRYWHGISLVDYPYGELIIEKLTLFFMTWLVAVFYINSASLAKTLQFLLILVCGYFVISSVTGRLASGRELGEYLNCLLNCSENEQFALGAPLRWSEQSVNQFLVYWGAGKILLNSFYLLAAKYWLEWRHDPKKFNEELENFKLSQKNSLLLMVLSLVTVFMQTDLLLQVIGYCALTTLSLFGIASLDRYCRWKQFSRYWLLVLFGLTLLDIKIGMLLLASVGLVDSMVEHWSKLKQANT